MANQIFESPDFDTDKTKVNKPSVEEWLGLAGPKTPTPEPDAPLDSGETIRAVEAHRLMIHTYSQSALAAAMQCIMWAQAVLDVSVGSLSSQGDRDGIEKVFDLAHAVAAVLPKEPKNNDKKTTPFKQGAYL